jgi:ribonuclease HI
MVAKSIFIHRRVQLFLFLHMDCTEGGDRPKVMMWNQIIGLTRKPDESILPRGNKNPHFSQRTREMGHPAPGANHRLMVELTAYVDGGCLGNPGPSGIGVVINGCADGPVRIAKWIGRQDNNVAEYAALMEALQYAVSRKARTLHVYSDSEVVVRQMTGEYVCRSPRLYSLHWTCRKLARSLKFSISHVPREDNAEANRLAQSALRRATGAAARIVSLP